MAVVNCGCLAPEVARAAVGQVASVKKVSPYALGLADADFTSEDSSVRELAFDRAAALNANTVRIDLVWRQVAKSQPTDPTNPKDSAYDFSRYDAAISEAHARGLVPILGVISAPDWAEGTGGPADIGPGDWRPNPRALGDFATALVSRYSGEIQKNGKLLPRVRLFEVWNEPNQRQFLAPQWRGDRPASPELYRRLVNAFNSGAHRARSNVEVIAGAVSPFGDDVGGVRMHPMQFLRQFLCLKTRWGLGDCDKPPKFDILSVHPISPASGPRIPAEHYGDLSIADLPTVRALLRRFEARHPKDKDTVPLWVSEYWWETNPPDQREVIPTLNQQARWIADAQFAMWQLGISVAIYYQLTDDPLPLPNSPIGTFQTGFYFLDGSAKPSRLAAYFPLVVRRLSPRVVLVWCRAPTSGELSIQRETGEGWEEVKGLEVKAGRTYTVATGQKRPTLFRATVADQHSYVWQLRR